jgi:steroid 5-alpha reductase family enzyme
MISPIFVTLLLTRVSGIPLLEKKADTKWGGQADYEEYKKNTPVLIPRCSRLCLVH